MLEARIEDLHHEVPHSSRSISRPRSGVAAGIAAGLLAGAAMALFLVGAAGVAGMPPLQPLRAIGATFAGAEALAGGAGPVLLGAALHLLVSSALGVVFATVFPRDLPPACYAVVGGGYALFALGFMASAIVPAANPLFRAEMAPIGGSWVVAHVVFGAGLGLLLAWFGRRRPEVAAGR